MHNNQTRMQYPSQRPQPNQFGAYSQGMTEDIGTTRSEQMMQGSMGGVSQAMQADRNAGYYGPSQPQQQWMPGGMQYGRSSYGGTSYGGPQGYSQPNQFGAYGQGMTEDIGTTRTEQMMQSGMGGIPQAMQADRNTGYYGPSQPQPQWGQGGMQYGRSNYGGTSYGAPQGYSQPNQFGAYSQGMTQDIGTTRTEQMMQSGMGGISQAMQADRNAGYYGPSQPQPQWSQSNGQGMSQAGNNQGYSGMYNPGDTAIEQQAKQNLGVSSSQTPSDEF